MKLLMILSRTRHARTEGVSRLAWLCGIGAAALLLLAILLPVDAGFQQTAKPEPAAAMDNSGDGSAKDLARTRLSGRGSGPRHPAEAVVKQKLTEFAINREQVARRMAENYNIVIPPEADAFFQAAQSGNWEALTNSYSTLQKLRETSKSEDLHRLWGPILETLLVGECAQKWPPEKLLEYGQATLGSLRPGMVYVGGTDPGRGIPTLLNETSDGERHVVITQNALADASYLEYVNFLYGDKLSTLTIEDSRSAFQEYVEDARRRLKHDQEFPGEPKQIRPGEDVRLEDNRLRVSGQVAVMAINEGLLRTFMNKNPQLSFALEESFPLESTYPNALPLGPIMELGVGDPEAAFTPEKARQTVSYWRDAAAQAADPTDSPESETRMTYAKMAASQAALLNHHNHPSEAEQAYRLAVQISPASPEANYGLATLLANSGRSAEAQGIIAAFQKAHPAKDGEPWSLTYKANADGSAR